MEGLTGHLIAGTNPPFLVDLFRYLPSQKALLDWGFNGDFVFFLSHFHSDHYAGLGRHWKRAPIWCSHETGNLIEKVLGVRPHLVFRLPVGEKTKVHGIDVTLIDANHCPGSVMFLFEGPGVGRSLHCGDFRFCPSMLQTLNPNEIEEKLQTLAADALVQKPSSNRTLDKVYLDTTYAGSKYSFPPQQEVLLKAQEIASEALKETASDGPVRFLVGTYTIGKERVALHLARSLNLKIFVAKQKRRILSCLQFSPEDKALFTESCEEAQIDLVPMSYCGSTYPPRGNFVAIRRHLQSLGLPETTRAIAFVATGWALGAKKTILTDGFHTVHLLPYSEHSSFAELQIFVKSLNPKEVIPTVSSGGHEGFLRLFRLFNTQESSGGALLTSSPQVKRSNEEEANGRETKRRVGGIKEEKEKKVIKNENVIKGMRQTRITAFFSDQKRNVKVQFSQIEKNEKTEIVEVSD